MNKENKNKNEVVYNSLNSDSFSVTGTEHYLVVSMTSLGSPFL